MDISLKHLQMIHLAIETHLDVLISEDNPPIPQEQHDAEIREFEKLQEMINDPDFSDYSEMLRGLIRAIRNK